MIRKCIFLYIAEYSGNIKQNKAKYKNKPFIGLNTAADLFSSVTERCLFYVDAARRQTVCTAARWSDWETRFKIVTRRQYTRVAPFVRLPSLRHQALGVWIHYLQNWKETFYTFKSFRAVFIWRQARNIRHALLAALALLLHDWLMRAERERQLWTPYEYKKW